MTDRVDYYDLTPEQRRVLEDWLREHQIKPEHTPIDPLLEYDDATGEWRIEQFWTDANGKPRLDEDRQDVRRIIVRRRSKSPLPWPTYEASDQALTVNARSLSSGGGS